MFHVVIEIGPNEAGAGYEFEDLIKGGKIPKIYINSVCNIFKEVGININTVPVLDVKRKKGLQIIGNRSFSYNPKTVKEMGKICINLHKNNKIGTVIKHIPGYGLSKKEIAPKNQQEEFDLDEYLKKNKGKGRLIAKIK